MKHLLEVIFVFIIFTVFSCGNGEEDVDSIVPIVIVPDTTTEEVEDSFKTMPKDTLSDTIHSEGTDIISFALLSENRDIRNEAFLIRDHIVHVMAPLHGDLTKLVTDISHNGEHIYLKDIEQVSDSLLLDFSDFTNPLIYQVISSLGETKEWTIIVYDLPVLIIDTPDSLPITSKVDRTEGCIVKLIHTDGQVEMLGTAGVRGRGNSTWELDKKPYNIKLDKKHEVLGMKKSKHWILLANSYYDRTQIHNATAFELARMTDYPWVQSGAFVELILNGQHQGLYYLCEKIGIEKGKIEITEMTSEDLSGEELTGGYLLESFIYQGYIGIYPFSTDYFNKTGGDFGSILSWEIKSPEGGKQLPKEQMNYIKNTMNQMEKLIYYDDLLKKGTYREQFDIETAINWFLVEEASLNEESMRTKNLYMYKNRGGKFQIGPPWDFDAWSFGLRGKTTFNAKASALYYRQLLKDPVFVKRLKEKWAEYMPLWKKHIPEFIDEQVSMIHRSVLRNEQMWPKWHTVNHYPDWEYDRCVKEMKSDFLNQLEWLNWKLQSF